MSQSKRSVIFVVGPTASGKSDWALRMAQQMGGVIVNCDSVQVYRQVEIGTAKPSKEERSLVPHYLFDYIAPPGEMTAGEYVRDFEQCLAQIQEDVPVFVVGGTGFYFQAIEKGMYPVIPVAEEIKKAVETEMAQPGGAQALYRELSQKDPDYAGKLAPADRYRVGRAVELLRSQGKTVTALQAEFASQAKPFLHRLLKVGPKWERDVLRERIHIRTERMLSAGLVEEVRSLLDNGLGEWAPMESVGYREVRDVLKGDLAEAELLEKIVISTHQLAKRQMTWFKRDQAIHWFDGQSGFEEARSLVEKFLTP